MSARFAIGDLVTISEGRSTWRNHELISKPCLVTLRFQMATGDKTFNCYDVIHGTKSLHNLHEYELDVWK